MNKLAKVSQIRFFNQLPLCSRNVCTKISKENFFKNGSTMSQLTDDLYHVMGIEKGFSRDLEKRKGLNLYLPKTQTDLPERTIKDSFLYGIIPLSCDLHLQDKYLSNLGHLRYGRLIEDMDLFAVFVLQKYLLNPNVPPGQPYPYTIVTIMVDTMLFTQYSSRADRDVRISGHVCTVGVSSAEVVIWLDQFEDDEWNKITETRFWMASRDAINANKAVLNPLKIQGAAEEDLLENAQSRRAETEKRNLASLLKAMPTQDEQTILHSLFTAKKSDSLPSGYKWMSKTIVTDTVLSFPQNRNLHNTVFGGFIMRHAIELAHCACYLFADSCGVLIAISEVKFNKPVQLGAIMQMHAQIIYTEHNFVQVCVRVDAVHMRTKTLSSNTVETTFRCESDVPGVYPFSYAEAMSYISGLRHFRKIFELRESGRPIEYIDFHNSSANDGDDSTCDCS